MTAFEPDGSRRRECGDNVHITTDQLGGQRARGERTRNGCNIERGLNCRLPMSAAI
jgi:hypothetical protein